MKVLMQRRKGAKTQRMKIIKNVAPLCRCAVAFKKQICLVLISAFLLSGCIPTAKRMPNLDKIFATTKTKTGKRPLIIIPGILGSELVNKDTGEKVWVNFSEVKGDGLSLPISPDLAKNRDNLIPKQILKTVKVSRFLPEISIYQTLIDAIEKYGGYTEDDWENPDVKSGEFDKYYVFAYDWRLDNVENARLLMQKVENLKRKFGNSEMRFNVMAHSMGGLIVRYAAMYGNTDLTENPKPNWDGARHFSKIFMFGTPNEGAMATLDTIINGYRIGGFEVDTLSSEVAITSPSVFQLLPHKNAARFYDENLQPVDVNLYDAETWKKYGWSAFARKSFRNKFAGQINAINSKGKKSEFADVALSDLDAYFQNSLTRAKQFHDALNTETSVPPTLAFFAFGSDCDDTQDGTILRRNPKTDVWETIFLPKTYKTTDGKKITKTQTKEKLYAPGDFRVTRRSLLAEDNANIGLFRRNLSISAVFSCEIHDRLPNNKIAQDNFLTALISEIIQ